MIRIVALTDAGQRLGQRLQTLLPGARLWIKPQPFAAQVQGAFSAGERLILICATGIAVRTLAPVLVSKHDDPPVLVLDEQGQFVIPLLSGHEGGANEWGREVALRLGAQLVLTTAQPYLQPVYTVGMGCERHCPQRELADLLARCLARVGLHSQQIHSINSIALKADEVGLIALAAHLDKPLQTFGVSELATMETLLHSRSTYVFNTVGVYGVAESAALLAAQQAAAGAAPELILIKHKTAKATCAIARAYPGPAAKPDQMPSG
jgi:cobalt-precorrin 5A hydrolase